MRRSYDKEDIYIHSSEDAYDILMKSYLQILRSYRKRENVWVLCLESSNRLTLVEHISMGSKDMSVICPREIFCLPLKLRSPKIIIGHNHPSGILRPSLNDYLVTSRLIRGGWLIDVKVADSIIFSNEGYYSFLDEGLM